MSGLLEDAKKIIEDARLGFEFVESRGHEVREDGNIEEFTLLVRETATGDEKEITITFDMEKSTADIGGLIEL